MGKKMTWIFYVILKLNANAGLRILEVTRLSVVLKACLSFQLFLFVFEYHWIYYLSTESIWLKQFTNKLAENNTELASTKDKIGKMYLYIFFLQSKARSVNTVWPLMLDSRLLTMCRRNSSFLGVNYMHKLCVYLKSFNEMWRGMLKKNSIKFVPLRLN